MSPFPPVSVDDLEHQWVTLPLEHHGLWMFGNWKGRVEDHIFHLLTHDLRGRPMIVVQSLSGSGTNGAWKAGRRVLSALVWIQGTPIEEISGSRMGNHARETGDQSQTAFSPAPAHLLAILATPEATTKKMLAIYREAIIELNPFYRFLCYFKVVNTELNGKKAQLSWMRSALPKLKGEPIDVARQQISQCLGKGDEADYLYSQCRCAVAHANGSGEADPDDPAEESRISEAMPLMRALAEYMLCGKLPKGGAVGYWNFGNQVAPRTFQPG